MWFGFNRCSKPNRIPDSRSSLTVSSYGNLNSPELRYTISVIRLVILQSANTAKIEKPGKHTIS
jgi:hypothetical protein